MRLPYICIALCALMTLSCGESANKQSANTATPSPTKSAEEEQEWQAPIEKIGASEIYPTADGGAYVMGPSGQLWYAKEKWAYRVSEATGRTTKTIVPDKAAGFALLSAERQRSRRLKDALDLAEFQVRELKETR